eukprot:GAHX01001128.1.p1 GENE.GAHX01001128.1~~GAHX01001128.1.p1  ORF type:complete len:459 (+),score=82.57 GAHX01001128.1:45-1421(+)
MNDTLDNKQHIMLTSNNRTLKLRVLGFVVIMGLSVYFSFHIMYLSVIYARYREALVKTMSFKINSTDFHYLTGSVKMKLQNYFGVPVTIHRITGFFVYNENEPKTSSSLYKETRRIFGSGSAEVNKTIKEGEVNIEVDGVLNFADVQALGHVLQGMALVNLKNPLEYHIFIDASITIFNHEFRITAPFIKVKPFVYNPLIILKRLFVGNKHIMALDESRLTKNAKKKIAAKNHVKNVYFLEDILDHFSGGKFTSFLNGAWHYSKTFTETQLLVKVLLIFKFYHINLTIPNLRISASMYFENDFIKFQDNSVVSKFNALKNYTPKNTLAEDVDMLQIQGIKDTEADAFTTKCEFNNKFLSEIKINNKIKEFWGIIWHFLKSSVKGKVFTVSDTMPTLAVGVDRTVNKFNKNFDYNNLIAERMGVLVFYFYPPNDEGTERNKKYIQTQDENEWFDDYGEP